MFLIVSSRYAILSALAISIGSSAVPVEDYPNSLETLSDTTGEAADIVGSWSSFIFTESEDPSLKLGELLSGVDEVDEYKNTLELNM